MPTTTRKVFTNGMELLHPRLITHEATKSMYNDTGGRSILSLICDKTALLFLENTKFDILKEDSAKEASSFKLLVHADNGENWPA